MTFFGPPKKSSAKRLLGPQNRTWGASQRPGPMRVDQGGVHLDEIRALLYGCEHMFDSAPRRLMRPAWAIWKEA